MNQVLPKQGRDEHRQYLAVKWSKEEVPAGSDSFFVPLL